MFHGGLISELERSVTRAAAKSVLRRCEWWCPNLGVVSHLRTHRTVCMAHFAWLVQADSR